MSQCNCTGKERQPERWEIWASVHLFIRHTGSEGKWSEITRCFCGSVTVILLCQVNL